MAEHALHAEGARLIGDDGHDAGADVLVAHQRTEQPHELHGGRVGAPAGALQLCGERIEARHRQYFLRLAALGHEAAEARPALLQIDGFRRVVLGPVVGHALQFGIGERNVEAVAEVLKALKVQFLHLMGGVLRLARIAHAVALDGLGQDHRRLALVVDRGVIGGIDLVGIVAAAIEPVDVIIGEVLDHFQQRLVAPEEALPNVGAALGLEVLVLAVHRLVHDLLHHAQVVLGEQRIPQPSPDHLDDVPARTPEVALQLLDDLAVAAHRAIEPLQVAVDHEDQVVELLPAGQGQGAEGFRLIALAVADEGPDLAVAHGHQAAAVQVLHDVGLVDGLQRPEPHADRGKLPVVRHQPRVGIGGKPLAPNLPAELVKLRFAQAPLQERTRVDARRGVALEVNQVAGWLAVPVVVAAAEKVVEAHVIEGGGGSEAGNVAPEIAFLAVGAHHHRQGVPADQGAYAPLHEQIPGHEGLLAGGNGVPVRGGDGVGQPGAGLGHAGGQPLKQEVGPLNAVVVQHELQGVQPLPGFLLIAIGSIQRGCAPRANQQNPATNAASCGQRLGCRDSILCWGRFRLSARLGLHPTANRSSNSRRQSKWGPGSVLRSGATSRWPTMASGESAG